MESLHCIHSYNGLRVANGGYVMPCCYYDEMKPFKDKDGNLIKTDTHTFEEMMDNPDRKKLIEDLENGIKHEGCKRCWDDEKYHGDSKRIRDTRGYRDNIKKNSKESLDFFINNDSPHEQNRVKMIELNLGNTCNLACRMCGVGASIKWYDEHRKIYDIGGAHKDDNVYKKWVKTNYKSYEDESMFWKELENELPHIEVIDMYGGEPMLMKKQWEVLKKSINLGYSKKQRLSFNTNGTIFREEYIDILKEFKDVVISFSIDAINDRFNYIRHHGDWNKVNDNIKKWMKFKREGLSFDIATTVTNLNIMYLDELADWCIDMKLEPYYIDVSYPDFYSPSNLPQSAKDFINNKLNIYLNTRDVPDSIRNGIIGCLNNMNSTDLKPHLWNSFLKNNKFLDESRKQSFEKTFEELNSVL